MPGFAETAAYFESRSKRSRSTEKRQELEETAKFYRTLASVTPTFPVGYKVPAPVKPNGSPQADRLYQRAEECRALAEGMRVQSCREILIRLALTYEDTASRLK